MGKLSVLKIARIAEPGRYGDGDGLWLQVRSSSNKSWLFRYMLNGRARQMGLGPVKLVSLADARERAWQCRRQLLEGIDPLSARDATRTAAHTEAAKSSTFRQCAEAFIASHETAWRNEKHRWQWSQTLQAHAYPVFGDVDIAAIDVALVMRVIEPIWTKMPETASRLRGRIERVLAWATARGLRSGPNPAQWRGCLDALLPARAQVAKVEHHPAMEWRQLPAFMKELRSVESIPAKALEFTILTAARTIETIGANWSEIDLENKVWIVPENRMKAGRKHRVPLSDRSIAIINTLPRLGDNAHIFPGARTGKGMSNMTMIKLLKTIRPGLTVHGFRSSFRDWAGDATLHPREVAEACLAHTVGSAVELAYRRSDALEKRRRLLQDWANYCAVLRSS